MGTLFRMLLMVRNWNDQVDLEEKTVDKIMEI